LFTVVQLSPGREGRAVLGNAAVETAGPVLDGSADDVGSNGAVSSAPGVSEGVEPS
jgi:hypothetical protein